MANAKLLSVRLVRKRIEATFSCNTEANNNVGKRRQLSSYIWCLEVGHAAVDIKPRWRYLLQLAFKGGVLEPKLFGHCIPLPELVLHVSDNLAYTQAWKIKTQLNRQYALNSVLYTTKSQPKGFKFTATATRQIYVKSPPTVVRVARSFTGDFINIWTGCTARSAVLLHFYTLDYYLKFRSIPILCFTFSAMVFPVLMFSAPTTISLLNS